MDGGYKRNEIQLHLGSVRKYAKKNITRISRGDVNADRGSRSRRKLILNLEGKRVLIGHVNRPRSEESRGGAWRRMTGGGGWGVWELDEEGA